MVWKDTLEATPPEIRLVTKRRGGAEHAQCLPPPTPSPAGTRGSKAKKDQRLSSNSLLQMERLPHETREEDPPPQYLCLSVSFMLPSWCSTQQPKGTLPDLP